MFANRIDIRHLRYFVETVRHGSIRGASQELHLSQPPLTRQIQYLEEVLGVSLLVRKRHGVEPTAAGQALYTEAVNILNLVEQACATTQLIGQGALGRLDVGVFGSAVLDIVPRIVLDFRKRYPNVEVILHNMDRDTQVKALQERRIAIGFNRFFLEYPGLQWETVVHEPMIIAMPRNHRLAGRASIALSDLAGEPMIFYPRASQSGGFSNFLLRAFHDLNIEPNVVQTVDDVVTAVAFVSSGVGLAAAVESARTLQLPDVVYVPLAEDDGPAAFDLCMIYRSGDESPLIDGFRQAVKTVTERPFGHGR
ncbi:MULTISPECIES: LysR substrate-binding domain-containing protein [Sphingobium]|jgi:DNA-binding transcriptional LysR family regulator|uniref:LysR family transcriptional regulator n=2 Tax=Sphingobium fuliginis (strain ATCC 27551) TaxID=336203 RepID=A0A7M2GLK0_SPHSA|nr:MULTISPECIES: LysR substrate-binding domain-containing protein [Sphingobium]AJR23841.1 LysR family transcriptional regulator [Sphingobium sp. YBL2]QDC39335.1 LysR family transcriptional regulator [Sphingobium fuliginis ATCC 27551]QOT73620.1 LysR family transcriptional regulator [Sphingobium fuliginis]